MAGARKRSFISGLWFRLLVILGVVAGLTVAFAMLDLDPDLSHLKVGVLSGSPEGNYHALVERLAEEAAEQRGRIDNRATDGSLDNLDRLVSAAQGCDVSFALAQDGLPWPDDGPVELVARLPVAESVLFLGQRAAEIRMVADLQGKTVGIGPEGSGTALLAEQLFASRGFRDLDVTLQHLGISEQMAKLEARELELGVFVIAPHADFVDRAVREHGLQIASFEHARSIAEHLPIVRAEVMPAGYYDPFLVLPPDPRYLLVVDTLVLGNGCASRTQNMGLLSLLETVHPDLVRHNLTEPNETGLPENEAAQSYFRNGGPEILDRYVPWLANVLPLANLIQLAMVLSIGMNVMTLGHQFRLWRIDTLRTGLEQRLQSMLGTSVPEVIAELSPAAYRDRDLGALDQVIEELLALRKRVRAHAVSWLVPMGQEMTYRHQENLVEERLVAVQAFRTRLIEGVSV